MPRGEDRVPDPQESTLVEALRRSLPGCSRRTTWGCCSAPIGLGDEASFFCPRGRRLPSPGGSRDPCRPRQAGHDFSRMLFGVRDPGLSTAADLAVGRLRLDRLSRNGGGSTFFPWASPIPREARKSPRRHPPLRSGPQAGAASIASGKRSPSRPRWSRARNSTGEVTWPTSVPSRSPATSTRARSSRSASRPGASASSPRPIGE